MILQDPRIYHRNNLERTEEIPAMPKYNGSWSPPPYWYNLLEPSGFEHQFKKWFIRVLFLLAMLYLFVLTVIFFGKLLVLVITLK